MTEKERDEKIAAIKADDKLPLPMKAKAIERVIAAFRTSVNGDGRQAAERARFTAYDAAPGNV
ncbi:MAG TPA: hypothetical protein VHQ01_03635 [Pyrinomonadaceae bacterium]|jgi:hypothetical protein|nr:hypothetical protein [Pyrinomonadaceae bacterium]